MSVYDTKRCSACGEVKPLTEFHKRGSGVYPQCKECRRPGIRAKQLIKKFGITQEQYDEQIEKQGGVCAICGVNRPFGMGARTGVFMIDHDWSCHPSGRGCPECIRGLLCTACNNGLAWLAKWDDRIAEYLLERPFKNT